MAAWIRQHRFTVARRLTQLGVLALFVGAFRVGLNVAGVPLIEGNYSASRLLGTVPLADPLAVLQMLAAGQVLLWDVLLGALLVLGAYALVGGRSYCAWVCPTNMVADAAEALRARWKPPRGWTLDRRIRLGLLLMALLLSALTGVAAFEAVSPMGLLNRALIGGLGVGAGFGVLAALGVLLFDLLVSRHGWCGHLCPLGAFYGLLGHVALLRVRFDAPTCTHCGDCLRVCPEPQVLNLRQAAARGMVLSGDCTNCGQCIQVCREDTLRFAWRGNRGRTTGQDAPGAAPTTAAPPGLA